MRIDGKVVLITGASEGIGAACVESFRRRGARLSLVARSEEKLKQVGGAGAVITAGDVTLPETRDTAVARTLERYGTIDILVNNAGVGLYSPSWRASIEETRRMYELNFFAPLALIQLVVPHMRTKRSGMIVNVGSIAGKMTLPWFTLYSTTKFALGSLTSGLRMELRDDGIQTMVVCPGYVKTRFQTNVIDGHPPDRLLRGRKFAITPEQCAEAITRGVERDARTVVTPAYSWIYIALHRLFPSLIDAQLAAIYHGESAAK
ncbi:MAG: SDR family NAD(P)-dependent oxidoreductase [Bryobacterales bacterium]|nr:SDR family NAD(P)-dependent oxidoreductase [Bryobacterales bacterium]